MLIVLLLGNGILEHSPFVSINDGQNCATRAK